MAENQTANKQPELLEKRLADEEIKAEPRSLEEETQLVRQQLEELQAKNKNAMAMLEDAVEKVIRSQPLSLRLARLGGRKIRVWVSQDGAYWPAAGDFDLDRLVQGRIYHVEVNADGQPSPMLELEAAEAPETKLTWRWPRPGSGPDYQVKDEDDGYPD